MHVTPRLYLKFDRTLRTSSRPSSRPEAPNGYPTLGKHWGLDTMKIQKNIFHLTGKMKKLIGSIYEKATQNDPSWNRPHQTYHCFYRETYIKGNDEKIVEGKEC